MSSKLQAHPSLPPFFLPLHGMDMITIRNSGERPRIRTYCSLPSRTGVGVGVGPGAPWCIFSASYNCFDGSLARRRPSAAFMHVLEHLRPSSCRPEQRGRPVRSAMFCQARASRSARDARTDAGGAPSRSVARGARKSRFACKFLSEDKSGRASCETGMERGTALAQKGDGVRPKQLLTGRSDAAHSLGASDAREAHAPDETHPCTSPPNPRPRRVPLPASNDLTSD